MPCVTIQPAKTRTVQRAILVLTLAIGDMPLGKRTDCGDAKYVGVSVNFPKDNKVESTLQVLNPAQALYTM